MSKNKINQVPKTDSLSVCDFENLFEYVKDKNIITHAKCLINNCDLNIKADKTGTINKFNIVRHLKRKHMQEYEAILKNVNEKSAAQHNENLKQIKISDSFKSSKLTINMDLKTFETSLVEMICLSSAPLSLFTGKGFLKIGGEIAKQLGVSLGYEAVRKLVLNYAEEGRGKLRKDLKDQLLFLKMDAATRGYRNFLAVNVQYFNRTRNESSVKLLDIIDTECQHNSEFIKSAVKKILLRFEIKESQILSRQ